MKWAPPYYCFVVKRRAFTCSLNSKYCSLYVVFGSKILVESFSFHFYSRCLDTPDAVTLLAGDCGHWEPSSIASTRNMRPKLYTQENGWMTGVLELMSLEKYKDRVRVDTSYCLQYIRRQSVSDKEIIFTVHLLYDWLREWCGAGQKDSARQIPCSFVDILNALLFDRTGFRVESIC